MRRLAWIVLACAACGDRHNDGALVVEVDTNLAPAAVAKITIEVANESGPATSQTFSVGASADLPVRMAVVPKGAPDFAVTVTATALDSANQPLVKQSASVQLGRTRVDRWLYLASECAARQCPSGESCVRGGSCANVADVGVSPPGPGADGGVDSGASDGPAADGPPADTRMRQPGPPGTWVAMPTPEIPATASLNSLWPGRANDIWVVGTMAGVGGVAYRYDGMRWTAVPPPPGTPALFGVFVAGPDDVVAVGLGGAALHYAAGGWQRITTGTTAQLTATWGTGPANVWVVGRAVGVMPTAARWNGTMVMPAVMGLSGDLLAVAGSGITDVWAAGTNGAIFHLATDGWQRQARDVTMNPLYGIWARTPFDVWVVGQDVALHFDGTRWTPTTGTPETSFSVWASGVDDAWAVGSPSMQRSPIARFDGLAWSSVPSPAPVTLNSVRGLSPREVWAAGNAGTVLRFQAP